MSSLRQNPISGDWVIVAEERALRPQPERLVVPPVDVDHCPFCAGHETETPTPILELPRGGPTYDPWQVRVVPNKYPALRAGVAVNMPTELPQGKEVAAYGAHEVVIESSRHLVRTADLTVDELLLVLIAFRSRIAELYADESIRYVQVFKNVGPSSGATIEHAHSQIVGLPFIPPRTAERLSRFRSPKECQGGCLLCSELDRERRDAVRMVAESESFAAFCPHASRAACETWIVPGEHPLRYEQASDRMLAELAAITLDACRRVDYVLDRPDYNLILQIAPRTKAQEPEWHWHLELVPRVAQLAGFEWGGGCFINPLPPEAAAKALRSAEAD